MQQRKGNRRGQLRAAEQRRLHALGAHLALDEWAAAFLGAVFALPKAELRSRVRAEGIAAFGLLDAA
ncbi:MAG: hypothetical protein EOP08_05755 [Proteobacteria bacterium]|nr:MAG: hypothetical protein EOP08_05755 [Pseudomonadota bacterium]